MQYQIILLTLRRWLKTLSLQSTFVRFPYVMNCCSRLAGVFFCSNVSSFLEPPFIQTVLWCSFPTYSINPDFVVSAVCVAVRCPHILTSMGLFVVPKTGGACILEQQNIEKCYIQKLKVEKRSI